MNARSLIDDAWAVLRVRAARLTRRFDARPARERLVMLLALAALAFWLADRVWITPSQQRAREAAAQLGSARQELAQLQGDLTRLKLLSEEQQRSLQAEISVTRSRVDGGAAALRAHEDTLVGADRMVELLEQMLPRHGRLKVRELKSLGRTDLLAAPGAAPAATPASAPAAGGMSVYRHGVELTLEGSYADLMEYLQALEKMPRRVLWGGMSLKVEQHPKVVLTLRLYTLSLDRGWLNL
jgi:MSHA biogenesis protein MshJ